MEPSEQQYQPAGDVSDSHTGKSRKKMLLILGILLLVIIIAAVLFAILGKGKDKKTAQNNVDRSDTSVYNNREGYDPNSYSADIGDPSAIKLTPKKRETNPHQR